MGQHGAGLPKTDLDHKNMMTKVRQERRNEQELMGQQRAGGSPARGQGRTEKGGGGMLENKMLP